jgi:hypothetical protein
MQRPAVQAGLKKISCYISIPLIDFFKLIVTILGVLIHFRSF